ncbi:MAG: hypothetical protein R3343_11315 [Nitriliruptorales bacterium]|nr:hypothetical protein [Nitriliruptorales bacterium]
MTRSRLVALVLAGGLVLAGCGEDDGASVRNLDGEGGGSVSGSMSGSVSGTHTGSGSGSATESGSTP